MPQSVLVFLLHEKPPICAAGQFVTSNGWQFGKKRSIDSAKMTGHAAK
jgi:hypothetical protein